jgi:hypothetical protein
VDASIAVKTSTTKRAPTFGEVSRPYDQDRLLHRPTSLRIRKAISRIPNTRKKQAGANASRNLFFLIPEPSYIIVDRSPKGLEKIVSALKGIFRVHRYVSNDDDRDLHRLADQGVDWHSFPQGKSVKVIDHRR